MATTKRQQQLVRYTIRDVRLGQAGFRTISEPWQVVDTKTGLIEAEFLSKRAATMTAKFWNKEPNGHLAG